MVSSAADKLGAAVMQRALTLPPPKLQPQREPDVFNPMARDVVVLAAWALLAANPAFAGTPLDECYHKAGDEGRVAVGACLDEMLNEAEKQMSAALAARRKAMAELARVTRRDKVVKSLDASQRQFLAYRKAQCQYVLDAMDAGTGAGDAQRDCMVRLTQQRIAELRNP
jgi:uncharacterized protein YecT (DUF1311 family)